jgi:hypothetical protein
MSNPNLSPTSVVSTPRAPKRRGHGRTRREPDPPCLAAGEGDLGSNQGGSVMTDAPLLAPNPSLRCWRR